MQPLSWGRGGHKLPAPSLVVAYYLHHPEARTTFLNHDLQFDDTLSVTGGRITYREYPTILTGASYLFITNAGVPVLI